MNEHFNQLTPGQAERLAVLIEEGAEVQRIACKVLRHGYESANPTGGDGGQTNRVNLAIEIGHFLHATQMLYQHGDVSPAAVLKSSSIKEKNIDQYLHHQKEKKSERS